MPEVSSQRYWSELSAARSPGSKVLSAAVGSTTVLIVIAPGAAGKPAVDTTLIVVSDFPTLDVKSDDATEIPAGRV